LHAILTTPAYLHYYLFRRYSCLSLPPQMLSKSDPPLLIWASETFVGKLQPNC